MDCEMHPWQKKRNLVKCQMTKCQVVREPVDVLDSLLFMARSQQMTSFLCPGFSSKLNIIFSLQKASEVYQPVADKLAVKHRSLPHGPLPLPYIYVYHRSTNSRSY